CALGLIWGFYVGWQSPYIGWMKWHHYAGLIFGVITFTWVFSGLLSMDPWDWHPSTAPTRAQRDAFSGGPLQLARVSLEDLRAAMVARPGSPPKEIDLKQMRGAPRVIVDGRPP